MRQIVTLYVTSILRARHKTAWHDHCMTRDMKPKTPIQVNGGPWDGHVIRAARKIGRCDYFRGIRDDRPASQNGLCPNVIRTGDLYLAGEMNDEAGGYGQDRYCLECAGVDARKSVECACKR